MSDEHPQFGRDRTAQNPSLSDPRALSAHYDAATGMITVELNRGYSISFHKSRHQALYRATDDQLSQIDLYPPDSVIFFPKLDDGFTVEGLVAGRFGSGRWEQDWAEMHSAPQAA